MGSVSSDLKQGIGQDDLRRRRGRRPGKIGQRCFDRLLCFRTNLPFGAGRHLGSTLHFDRSLRFGLHSLGAVSRGARFGLFL
jgi:hypothetical protein